MNIPISKAEQVENSETSKIPKFESRGSIGEISWKNTPNNNLSTMQPISTDSIPIDSAQQAEQNWDIKNSKFHSRGHPGNFHEKITPKKTF